MDAASCPRLILRRPRLCEGGILSRIDEVEILNESPIISFEVLFLALHAGAGEARDFVGEHLAGHDLLYLVDDIRLLVR